MTYRQPGDARSDDAIAAAEAVLSLDAAPADAGEQLRQMLHPAQHQWLEQFRTFVSGGLAPHRVDIPIEAPGIDELRPMVWNCSAGHTDTSWDASPAWGRIFGSGAEAAQRRIRSLFRSVRDWKTPAIDDKLIAAICQFIVAIFVAAAEQQAKRLERQAGPRQRMQSAQNVLAALEPFRQALVGFDKATADASGLSWVGLRDDLGKLERVARAELR